MPSSFSDTELYRESCRMAAMDADLFAIFRRLDYIEAIIEPWATGGGDEQLFIAGVESLNQIRGEPSFADDWALHNVNDTIGMPRLLEFPGIGLASPYTLRYMKAAYDLRAIFGSLDGLDIVEVGGGYGGQCAILSRMFSPRSYTLVDLPETLMLAERYLQELQIPNVRFAQADDLPRDQRFGLFISNYAYTELDAPLRKWFLDKVMKASDRGFLLWNLRYFETQRLGDVTKGKSSNDAEVAALFAEVPNGRLEDRFLYGNDHHYGNQLVIWG